MAYVFWFLKTFYQNSLSFYSGHQTSMNVTHLWKLDIQLGKAKSVVDTAKVLLCLMESSTVVLNKKMLKIWLSTQGSEWFDGYSGIQLKMISDLKEHW